MFTSRAEFRLSLRADNADERLTPLAAKLGIASAERMQRLRRRHAGASTRRVSWRLATTMTPNEAARHGLEINQDGVRRSAYELLAYPGVDVAWLARIEPEFAAIDAKTAERLETEAKYSVYLDRQQADVAQIRHEESRLIPDVGRFCRRSGPVQRAEAEDAGAPAALHCRCPAHGRHDAGGAGDHRRACPQRRGCRAKGCCVSAASWKSLQEAAGPVSRETFDRLVAFEQMFQKWNRSINLAAQSTQDDVWQPPHPGQRAAGANRARRPSAGSISARAADFRAWCWLFCSPSATAPASIWSKATARKHRSCKRSSASSICRPGSSRGASTTAMRLFLHRKSSRRGRWPRFRPCSTCRRHG